MDSGQMNAERMNALATFRAALLVSILVAMGCGGRSDISLDGLGASSGGSTSGSGGSTSGSGGSTSTSDLDTCTSDADCVSCNLTTKPTSSDQCTGWYCCQAVPVTQRRCDANQNAWNLYCSGKFVPCLCVGMICSLACVNGQCIGSCASG